MRLVRENVERDGSGTVTLYPEDPEDMVRLAISPPAAPRSPSAVGGLQPNPGQRPAAGLGAAARHHGIAHGQHVVAARAHDADDPRAGDRL